MLENKTMMLENYEKVLLEKPQIKYHSFIFEYVSIDDFKCKFCGKMLRLEQDETSNNINIKYCLCKKRTSNKIYMQTIFGQNTDIFNKYWKVYRSRIILKSRKQQFIDKYGEEEGLRRYQSLSGKSRKQIFIDKYGEEEGLKKYALLSGRKWKQIFIDKYGEEECLKKYKHWQFTSSGTLEKFIYKHGEEEGTKRYNEFRQKCSPSLESQIFKHGKEEGTKKHIAFKNTMKKASHMSLGYWLKQFNNDKELAKKALTEHQKRDKKYFFEKYDNDEANKRYERMLGFRKTQNTLQFKIDKYGEKAGKQKYEETKKKIRFKQSKEFLGELEYGKLCKSKAQTLENYIKRLGNEKGIKQFSLFREKIAKHLSKGFHQSIIAVSFFNELLNNIKNKHLVFYNTNEYWLSGKKQFYFYDFCYLPNKIIEFHGDYWHCNPLFYNEDHYHIKKEMFAKEIWDYQEQKNDFARSKGFEVFEIWENDVRKNIKDSIEKAIKFIGETNE